MMGEAGPTSAASRTGQPLGVVDSFGAIVDEAGRGLAIHLFLLGDLDLEGLG